MTARLLVPSEALRDVHMTDDVGRVVSARFGVGQQCGRAEGVVVVAVCVHHVPDRKLSDGAELLDDPRPAHVQAGIDHGDGVVADEERRVPEAGEEVHARCDLAGLAGPARSREGLGCGFGCVGHGPILAHRR